MTTLAAAPRLEPMTQLERNARRSILIMLGGIIGYDVFSWYLAVTRLTWQLFVVAGVVLLFGVVDVIGLQLARRGRGFLGLWLTVLMFSLTDITIGFMIRGLGVSLGLICPILTVAMVTNALPRRQAWDATLAAAGAGVLIAASDLLGAGLLGYRDTVPVLLTFTPIIATLVAAVYGLYLIRLLADYSLRAKLIIAFLAVTLLPLGALAAVDYRATQQALTDAANQALLGAAAQTALTIDTFFDNTRGVVLSESQLPAVRDYLAMAPDARSGAPAEKDLKAIMQNWALRDTRASSYLLLDKAGVVALSTSSLDIGKDLAATGYFQQAMSSGQSTVSDVLFQPKAENGEIDFGVAVVDQSHNFAGVLVARFSTRLLQDLVGQTSGLAGSQSFGVLYDNNLLQLASGAEITQTFRLVSPVTPLYLADLQAQNRVPQLLQAYQYSLNRPDLASPLAAMLPAGSTASPYFTTEDVVGSGRLNQVAVARLSSKPWLLAFYEPRDVFLAPVQRQTSTTLTLAALIAVIVTAGAVLAAQVLADPLTRLTGTAEKVAAGDLSVKAEVGGRDEIGMLASTFNSMTGRLSELVGTLESRVAERTAQLQAAADIGRATASVRSLDELLRLSLDLIRDRFGFYHASIFLIDEANHSAVLRESTGTVGAQLKARGHKLGIGSQSLIGWVTENRRPRVALDVADDPYHFRNPLLPDTRAELAIPLMVGDRLLGALDVQSTQANAFGAGDVQVLQTLADQLSVAIENAELFQRTQASLNELSIIYQRMTGASWRGFLRGEKREAQYEAKTPALVGAPQDNQPLALPLLLRDRSVGVIEIYGRPAADWSDEEKNALSAVAAQVSAALETAALLEETQRRRLREQLINDITYQMRATMNPATVVQSGMRELGRALGATEVVVRLGPEGAPAAAAPALASEPEAKP
jgi:GAF domain-containing protein/HAMP domain-containing protein